jgi:PAS domain S-box-containing protein
MYGSKLFNGNSKFFKHYSISIALFWTALILALGYWEILDNKADSMENAYLLTKVGFDKDVLYRRWATNHGGLYAPVTEQTQPNPYLSEISERDISTPSGKKLTLVNPAYMSRQVYELEKENSEVISHLTSLKPIRPENKPDEWETKALQSFEKGINEVFSIDSINGRAYFRYMQAFYIEQGCLKCHEKDGYKLNEIRGGISVSYPKDKINAISESNINSHLLILLVLWFLGICIIIIGYFRLRKSDFNRRMAELALESAYDNLEHEIQKRTSELLEAKKNWKNIFNSINAPAQIIDINHNIIAINNATVKLTAKKHEDLIGKKCHDVFHCAEEYTKKCPFDEADFSQTGHSNELFISQFNKHFLVSITPVYNDTNSFDRYIHIMTDITERKNIEEKLRESEDRYKGLYENVPTMNFNLDRNGTVIAVNTYGAEQLGFTKKELIGQSVFKVFPDKLHENVKTQLKTCFDKPEKLFEWDIQKIKKDGTIIWVHEVARVLKDNNLNDSIFIACQDITDRKNTETALKESEAHYTDLYENSPDMFVSVDAETGLIKECNQTLTKKINYSKDEIIGQSIFEIYHPECISNVKSAFKQFKTTGEVKNAELLLKKKNGDKIDVILNATAIRDSSGKITLSRSSLRDISELKVIQQELKQSNFELKTINKVISESTGEMDIKKLMTLALDEALNITGLEGGTVCNIDENRLLKLIVERNTSESTKYDLEFNEIKIGECMCGNCALDKKPLILNNREEVLSYSSREALRNEDLRFHAAFPIISKGESTGVLCVFSYSDFKPTESSLKLAETLTNQMALALENASLYKKIHNQLKVLHLEIKERKLTEIALAESEKNLRELIDNLPAGVIVHDKDTKIVMANEMAMEILALNYDELTGKTAMDPQWHFFNEDESPMLLTDYPVMKVKNNSQALHNYVVGVNRPKNNDRIWALANAFPTFDDHNVLDQIIVTFIEITKRKEIEHELQKHQGNLEKLIKERTAEIESKNELLTRMNNMFVGREIRMAELKKEIDDLRNKLNQN